MNENQHDLFKSLQQKEAYSILVEIESLSKALSDLNSVSFLISNFFTKTIGQNLEYADLNGKLKKEMLIGAEDRASTLIRNNEEKMKLINEMVSRLYELKSQYGKTEETLKEIISILKTKNID